MVPCVCKEANDYGRYKTLSIRQAMVITESNKSSEYESEWFIKITLIHGGSSTKSLRPQPKKVGGWLTTIFEKKSIYLKIVLGFLGVLVLYHDNIISNCQLVMTK